MFCCSLGVFSVGDSHTVCNLICACKFAVMLQSWPAHELLASPPFWPAESSSFSAEEEEEAPSHSRTTSTSLAVLIMSVLLHQRQSLLKALIPVVLSNLVFPAAAGTCEDVWFVEGIFNGEDFTCGERILYLQTEAGGLHTEQYARVKTALEDDKCADCWPWEKYREDGESERSPKRGVAIENYRLTAETLNGLAKVVTWGKTWDYQARDGPSQAVWDMAGVEFVPMVWGNDTIPIVKENGLAPGREALLGFNEPNFPTQSNLSPQARIL